MRDYPDHPLLLALRQMVAAAGRGDSRRDPLPLAEATGTMSVGPDREATCPRPNGGEAFRFTVRAGALRADEDWILGLILGDDAVESEDDSQIRLTWCLGAAHLKVSEAAAAYSLASLVGDRVSTPAHAGSGGFMRWLAARLDSSRLGETVELDGSLPLVVLGEDLSSPLPYIVSPLGRGVHAVPANAVMRAYAESARPFLERAIQAATIRPRGSATRWRDRQGRSCYVLGSDLGRMIPGAVGPFRPPNPP